jgi:hypothetical protein
MLLAVVDVAQNDVRPLSRLEIERQMWERQSHNVARQRARHAMRLPRLVRHPPMHDDGQGTCYSHNSN